MALVRGRVAGRTDVLAWLHARCIAGETFGSPSCDCGGGCTTHCATVERRRREVDLAA